MAREISSARASVRALASIFVRTRTSRRFSPRTVTPPFIRPSTSSVPPDAEIVVSVMLQTRSVSRSRSIAAVHPAVHVERSTGRGDRGFGDAADPFGVPVTPAAGAVDLPVPRIRPPLSGNGHRRQGEQGEHRDGEAGRGTTAHGRAPGGGCRY